MIWVAISPWVLWGLYIIVMGLYRAHKARQLTWFGYLCGAPYIAAGYALDMAVNLLIGSVLFLELPRELLLTDRLRRLMPLPGWRGAIARWICRTLLDVFDPEGRHCN